MANKSETFVEYLSLFKSSVKNPKLLAYREDGIWFFYTPERFLKEVDECANGLLSLGVKPGDFVAIMGDSSPHWVVADFAIKSMGAITLPIFPSISDENYKYEMTVTGARIVLGYGDKSLQEIEKHPELIDHFISLERSIKGSLDFEKLLEKGRSYQLENPKKLEEIRKGIKPDDTAMIIFTSGSTGVPKGVVLTQKNVSVIPGDDKFEFRQSKDSYVNILPLAHIYGHVVIYGMLRHGLTIYFLTDPHELAKVCKEVKPTILCLVPRLIEKIRSALWVKANKESFLKKHIALSAFKVAMSDNPLLKPVKWVMDKLVYSKVRAGFGGKVRILLSSSNTLSVELQRFLLNMGLPVLEGYGLTESAPISTCYMDKIKAGKVGRPCAGVQVKIGPQDEILVKSDATFKGYYKNEEATRAAFDEEGWFRTGDKGKFDEEGFLSITGRMNDLFKTSTGLFVTPALIEQRMNELPIIESTVVLGENQKYVACLLFPDYDVLASLKNYYNCQDLNDQKFLDSPMIQEQIQTHINRINRELNEWEQIRKFKILDYRLTVEDGALTPSFKIKRKFVHNKFATEVDSFFAEG